MSLGKAVVGGVVGALVGGAAQVATEQAIGQAFWFPVVTGLITAIGVRKFDPSTSTSVSFLRGGLAAVLALAGIFGAALVGSKISMERARAESEKAVAPVQTNTEPAPVDSGDPADSGDEDASDDDDQGDEDQGDEDQEEAPEVEQPPAQEIVISTKPSAEPVSQLKFALKDFICMAAGTFLAYEFSRGTATRRSDADNDGDSGADADADPPATGAVD